MYQCILVVPLLLASLIGASGQESAPASTGDDGLVPGLVATFKDDVRAVSEVVMLPELGLAAEESPHPSITPAFNVSYEGFLQVTQAGLYQFDTNGTLIIDGAPAKGELALTVGQHALQLTYQRAPGELCFGLAWQSDQFVKEPVPPTVLWHTMGAATPAVVEKGTYPAPPYRIREAFAEMKCASCHDANFLGTMHHKFKPESLLTLIRHANPPKWYAAMTGPLLPEGDTLTRMAADLRKLPHGQRTRGQAGADTNSARSMVGSQGGLACIACHDFMNHKTEAETKGPNLAQVTDRISYDWFVRWMNNPGRLKPGVPMPPFFAGLTAADRQQKIDALWDYISQGMRMKLPDELLVAPQQFILKPTAKPLYTRAYMRLPNGRELLRAICVGLPNGVSYCFDAETCQLAYVWTGGFLDMAPHWQNQSGSPTPAIGNPFYLPTVEEGLRIGDHKARFQGYEIVGGIPRFEFTIGDASVRLLIDAPAPDQVRQTYTVGKRVQSIIYVGPPKDSPFSMTASHGTWTDNRLSISHSGDVGCVLTMEKKK